MRKGFINLSNRESIKNSCVNYLAQRRSSFEFRSIRYEAVYDQLNILGLQDHHSITDVGAGDGEFGKYLHSRGFRGKYNPIDGLIDGTDLNLWTPKYYSDFMVSIEVIEHLIDPNRFLGVLDNYANMGIVVTTPNPAVVNIYQMDQTHISEVWAEDFFRAGYKVHPQIFFAEPEDSLLAWKSKIWH